MDESEKAANKLINEFPRVTDELIMHLSVWPIILRIEVKNLKKEDPENFYKMKFAGEKLLKSMKEIIPELEKSMEMLK